MGCTEADDFAQRLAEAIDGQVVVGDGTHDDRLVLGRLTVGDLKA